MIQDLRLLNSDKMSISVSSILKKNGQIVEDLCLKFQNMEIIKTYKRNEPFKDIKVRLFTIDRDVSQDDLHVPFRFMRGMQETFSSHKLAPSYRNQSLLMRLSSHRSVSTQCTPT